MRKIQCWCRTNAMLAISLLAAAATAFFVPPDRDYLGYYDLKTLSCLFSVLAVVGALRDLQIFSALSQRMVRTFSTVRGVCTALVVITMFGSMLLTNDTALLTFLPLGWFVLSSTGQEKHAALLFILQNCAANLCGMITPSGSAGHSRLPPGCRLWRAVLFSRCHGAAAGTLCSWPDCHCSGTLVSGSARIEGRRLGTAGYLRRFLHLFRQSCPDGIGPGAVRPPFVPRNNADLRAHLPDHQQCPCRHSTQSLHAGCPRSSGWRQCGRCRDAGGFSCEPHYVSGIYAPCSQWRKEFSSPVFRDQLCISGDSFDCHVRSDVISRFQRNALWEILRCFLLFPAAQNAQSSLRYDTPRPRHVL